MKKNKIIIKKITTALHTQWLAVANYVHFIQLLDMQYFNSPELIVTTIAYIAIIIRPIVRDALKVCVEYTPT